MKDIIGLLLGDGNWLQARESLRRNFYRIKFGDHVEDSFMILKCRIR
jgi:hypothetical protein